MYKIIERKQEYVARFEIIMDTIERNGNIFPYSFVKMKAGVVVVPVTAEGICIIKQYRHPVSQWSIEFPGGIIDSEETPEDAAIRELHEESGCINKKIYYLGMIYPSIGCTDEVVHIFVSYCKKEDLGQLDVSEIIQTELVSEEKIDEMLEQNKIIFGTTIIAWQKYKNFKNKLVDCGILN